MRASNPSWALLNDSRIIGLAMNGVSIGNAESSRIQRGLRVAPLYGAVLLSYINAVPIATCRLNLTQFALPKAIKVR